MNYEKGLSRLEKYIRKDDEAIKQVTILGSRLHSICERLKSNTDDNLIQEYSGVICELNKFARRTTGASFVQLCADSPQPILITQIPRSISLAAILCLIIGGLFLPGLGIASATSIAQITANRQLNQIQQDVQEIDNLLRNGISAPFYLSPADPCSIGTLQIIQAADLVINLTVTYKLPDLCVWEYRDKEFRTLIAKDYWGFRHRDSNPQRIVASDYWGYLRFLQKREYYKRDRLIATDVFDWKNNDCFKRRIYPDILNEECYSEAGKLRTEEPSNTILSPIPPITYWFFYR